jgi:hypothetical protein
VYLGSAGGGVKALMLDLVVVPLFGLVEYDCKVLTVSLLPVYGKKPEASSLALIWYLLLNLWYVAFEMVVMVDGWDTPLA